MKLEAIKLDSEKLRGFVDESLGRFNKECKSLRRCKVSKILYFDTLAAFVLLCTPCENGLVDIATSLALMSKSALFLREKSMVFVPAGDTIYPLNASTPLYTI